VIEAAKTCIHNRTAHHKSSFVVDVFNQRIAYICVRHHAKAVAVNTSKRIGGAEVSAYGTNDIANHHRHLIVSFVVASLTFPA